MTAVAGGPGAQQPLPGGGGGNILSYTALPGSFGGGARSLRRRTKSKGRKGKKGRKGPKGGVRSTKKKRKVKGGSCPCNSLKGGAGIDFKGALNYT